MIRTFVVEMPLDEGAVRALMVRVFARCDELGLEPDPTTVHIHEMDTTLLPGHSRLGLVLAHVSDQLEEIA